MWWHAKAKAGPCGAHTLPLLQPQYDTPTMPPSHLNPQCVKQYIFIQAAFLSDTIKQKASPRCLFYSFHSSGHHHKQNWFISGITVKVCISSYLKVLHFTQRYFNRKPNYFELYLIYREDLIVFFIHIPVQNMVTLSVQ